MRSILIFAIATLAAFGQTIGPVPGGGGGTPSGAAGGSLTGTYPNPGVVGFTAGASDPATCTPGVTLDFWNTTSSAWKYCAATNTWSAGRSVIGNLSIGTTVHDPATSEPTCDASKRGHIVRVQGGAGVADTYRQCIKGSDDNYSWAAFGGGVSNLALQGTGYCPGGGTYPACTASTTAATINPANGYNQWITLTAANACALTLTQPVSGTGTVRLHIKQAVTPTGTVTWPACVRGTSGACAAGGLVPVVTPSANAVDICTLDFDGLNVNYSCSSDHK